jgi:hypothetical protein
VIAAIRESREIWKNGHGLKEVAGTHQREAPQRGKAYTNEPFFA